ncbi:histidine phosphatase family protein [Paenibacillus tengchongensis]|uniref:histidine phosphatase family protein n=1 Tax=Paenibacillus tengchongensis TaxID=2608684 RepID=UPI00124E81B9|nr:histidine phosphatase family protein [Paenibacillus tengchongensis]
MNEKLHRFEINEMPDKFVSGDRLEIKAASAIQIELRLVRHGHTLWNTEHRYLGSTDLPLLPEAAAALAALREYSALQGDFWRVYCSDLRRCRETLGILGADFAAAARYDKRLREMDFGKWEGCTYEQLQNSMQYRAWIDDPQAVTPPGGESWTSFTGRVEELLEELKREAAAEADGREAAELPAGGRAAQWREDAIPPLPPEALPPGALSPGALSPEALSSEALPPEAQSPEALPSEGQPSEALPPEALPPEGQPSEGQPSEALSPEALSPEPLRLRVLAVTHGGVIRHILSAAAKAGDFRAVPAPPPGTPVTVTLTRQRGSWAWGLPGAK